MEVLFSWSDLLKIPERLEVGKMMFPYLLLPDLIRERTIVPGPTLPVWGKHDFNTPGVSTCSYFDRTVPDFPTLEGPISSSTSYPHYHHPPHLYY